MLWKVMTRMKTEDMYVATIGFFDGVHRGHRFLLEQVCDVAHSRSMSSMAITFDRHPRQVLSSDYQPLLLTSLEEKVSLLGSCGVDRIEVVHFTLAMSRMPALEFMRKVLKESLGVSVLLMGYDHQFGHGGGSFHEYREWGEEVGIEVLLATKLPGMSVSSSRIRKMIALGDIEGANHLLGHPFVVEGEVVSGHRVGREIGFPTANVSASPGTILPHKGVYAVEAELPDGSMAGGMLCIGNRPTLQNGSDISVEAHLFDFDGDLYGKRIRLMPVARLRDERRFSSLGELQRQLKEDECEARRILTMPS